MTACWRSMDRATLDIALNNGTAVSEWPSLKEKWQARSAELRLQFKDGLDLRYGNRPRNRIDWFAASAVDAPVIVFVHGGYWQWNDKEDFSFIAKGALSHGFSVALIEYTLAPAARIGEIVAELGAALDFIAARCSGTARCFLVGHSAGGHLTEHYRGHPAVIGNLSISGIFDLEPISFSYVNAPLQLTAEEIEAYSPIRHPLRGAPLLMTVGGLELSELLRQTNAYHLAALAADQNVKMIPSSGYNHFDILESFADAEGALMKAVLDSVS